MAVALKIAQLLERDGVPEMQIGRRRIHPSLMRSGTAQLEFLRQLSLRDHFDRPPGQRRRAFLFVALFTT